MKVLNEKFLFKIVCLKNPNYTKNNICTEILPSLSRITWDHPNPIAAILRDRVNSYKKRYCENFAKNARTVQIFKDILIVFTMILFK